MKKKIKFIAKFIGMFLLLAIITIVVGFISYLVDKYFPIGNWIIGLSLLGWLAYNYARND